MVKIRKQFADNGYYFEVDDFGAYQKALAERGVEISRARYRVFISFENERRLVETTPDWERQIELFFQLGSGTRVPCQIVSA